MDSFRIGTALCRFGRNPWIQRRALDPLTAPSTVQAAVVCFGRVGWLRRRACVVGSSGTSEQISTAFHLLGLIPRRRVAANRLSSFSSVHSVSARMCRQPITPRQCLRDLKRGEEAVAQYSRAVAAAPVFAEPIWPWRDAAGSQ